MLRARLGVRARILAIALIPSLALLVIGVGAAGYLLNEGWNATQRAQALRDSIGPTRDIFHDVQQERMLSLWQLGGDRSQSPALAAARGQLDTTLQNLIPVEARIGGVSSSKMQENDAGFDALKQQLPAIRAGIDSGALPLADVYAIYNKMADGVTHGAIILQQSAPTTSVAIGFGYANQLLFALEAFSRASGLTAAALGGEPLSPPLAADLRNNAGYYQAAMPQLVAELGGAEAQALTALTTTPAWRQIAAVQDAVLHPAASKNGAAEPVPMNRADWLAATEQVGRTFLDQWDAQQREDSRLANADAATNTRNSLLAGGAALAISVVAFLIALWLANRLIGRLKRLRTETLALAEVGLPETMRRLRDGEHIDPETESVRLDFGHDEIGSVAKAFNQAHTAAVAAAVTEAKTREGVRAVFLNIAHRSQLVVYRQLELLDEAESRQEDPALLDTFFRLDHLATRERRNAENLIILGGGRPGRQWRRPVPLVEVVRSAVGEALDYARVHTARMPQVFVNGDAVADVIHLLAELVDNATAFSPPQSRVDLTGNRVGKGVVVEIGDQGMGMSSEELERSNEMLRNPPDFGVATLLADSRLGLFVVAQLGARHGISVRLAESDYGGIRAIVLIPTALITTDAPVADHLPDKMPVRSVAATGEMPALTDASGVSELGPAPAAIAVLPLPRQGDAGELPDPQEPDYGDGPRLAHRLGRHAVPERPAEEQWRTTHLRPAQEPQRDRDPRPGPARPSYSGGDTRPPLPRRRRQASLAPELETPPEQPAAAPAPPARTAEYARDLMSAIENGTRQGRQGAPDREVTGPGRIRPENPPRNEQEGERDYFPRR